MIVLAFTLRLSLGKVLSNFVLGCEASMICTLKSKQFWFWSSQHTHTQSQTHSASHYSRLILDEFSCRDIINRSWLPYFQVCIFESKVLISLPFHLYFEFPGFLCFSAHFFSNALLDA